MFCTPSFPLFLRKGWDTTTLTRFTSNRPLTMEYGIPRNSFPDPVSNSLRAMKNSIPKFAFASLAGLFVLFATTVLAQNTAREGTFIVAQHGSTVGSASYNFSPTSDGYDSTSKVHVSMEGLKYEISKTQQLTQDARLKHVELSAKVNDTAVNITGDPQAAQFMLNISANGNSSTTPLDLHRNAVFMPDFDPGAYETLLALAVKNNNRDLWAIIPKQAGTVVPIKLATYADEKGTMEGQPIEVHHLVATISGNDTHIFSGPHNHLLQVEFPYQGFALVRKGFVLTPPAKAGPPPTPPPGKPADQPPPTQ